MSFELARVIIDFGLVVLIWMVQLVIYPSFSYYKNKNLIKWHKRYTFNVSLIVIPLMTSQLGLYIYQVLGSQTVFTVSGLSMAIIAWMSTFVLFVPLHQQITNNQHTDYMLKQLVSRNWFRTLLWTGLFLWSLNDYLT